MMLIDCPFCGPRNESEFSNGGEAHIVRPEDPSQLNDEEWADFLFMKKNTRGIFAERWMHAQGCRRWFNAIRDTRTHEILHIYKTGEQPPEEYR